MLDEDAARPRRTGRWSGRRTGRRIGLGPGRLLRAAFVVATVGFGCYAVYREWQEVRHSLGRLAGVGLLGSLAAVLVGLAGSMLVWRALLADLGSRLPLRDAARIFFVGQLGKYLPGSVWPALAQMEMGRAYDIPRRRSATAFVLTVLVVLAAGLLVAGLTLPLVASGTARSYRWVLVAAPLLLAGLHPRVLNPALTGLLRLARRPEPDQPLSARGVAVALAASVGSWLAYGVHAWVLAVSLGADAGRALLLCVGGFALAWSAGFLVVIAPAGAGVREVALVAALAPVLDRGEALVVALASRLLMTLGDLACAALAGWRSRRGSR